MRCRGVFRVQSRGIQTGRSSPTGGAPCTVKRTLALAATIVLILLSAAADIASSQPASARATPAPPLARAPAPSFGRIEGRVLDADSRPVEYSRVDYLEGKRGALTDSAGRFVLARVPVGRATLRVNTMRNPELTQVIEVQPGAIVQVTLKLGKERMVATIDPMIVHGRKKIDPNTTEWRQTKNYEDIKDAVGDGYTDVVKGMTGVVVHAGQLSIRGSRADELQVRFSDVDVTDPQQRRSAEVAGPAVANIELTTGGANAESGGALSGVLNVQTREGADSLGGELRWDTDRYGDATKTFDRYDHVSLGLGGPGPFRGLTFFAATEATFSDPYPASSKSSSTHTVLDFISLGNRQSNVLRSTAKLAYRPTPRDKLTLESSVNHTIETPYEHMWSRRGYVQVRPDTSYARDGSMRIVPRYGTWSALPVDSNSVAMNLADHTPTNDNTFRQLTAAWVRQDSNSVLTLRGSAVDFNNRRAVGRLEPWEYDTQAPFYWSGNLGVGSEDNPYFVTHGDFPRYERRQSTAVALKGDVSTSRWQRHTFKSGIEARYNRIQNLSLVQPNQESDGLPGASRSEFVNYQPEGSWYAQDRWQYEGLVLNAGVRYDVFTPGAQIAASDLPSGNRFKQQVSPRLGVAYPISVRDVLSFHYGWTYQTPQRGYVFENRGLNANVNIRGNPDLEPETNIAYQAALQHLFTNDLSGQFAVFFRDIFGLITARQEKDAFGNLVNQYSNGDYASARGVEASLAKSFSHRFSADLNYTYSLATGVASDPAEALLFFNGGRRYLPIGESMLNWDQRHTVSLRSTIREPGRWGVRMVWSYGSGLPFTPEFREDRRPDPKLANSRRLPSSSTLSIDLDQYLRVWGQNLTLYVDARNVLSAENITDLTPNAAAVFNPNVNAVGDDYRAYYTETGRIGGAYLQDRNGDGQPEWIPVHDPRVVEEGRQVRLGLALAF